MFQTLGQVFTDIEHMFQVLEHKFSLGVNYFSPRDKLKFVEKIIKFSFVLCLFFVPLTSSKVLRYGNAGINKKNDDKVCDLLYIFIL